MLPSARPSKPARQASGQLSDIVRSNHSLPPTGGARGDRGKPPETARKQLINRCLSGSGLLRGEPVR
ncbi:hypothetical protein I549_5884 [Mycobacterium avium subsp. avium 2285 (R)]|uniref:Uncharacterized protein n=1 Tax=Mycobacterium avium (strain 104) TaxID=243243 RepID=A0A0H3A440_MYCA1|nr:conserved hypothetical protein [Mycobacterium avium 104]ETZ46817.1 hypothetical protein L837_3343 [Mycobacterium avium MAV_061107_1842]ETZ53223.1 hypothetical protein L840_4804 [Mycobacterium sp. MAC_011194_8550]ETZ75393.1 hypothetical protein L841_0356 [Mycobacterium sp. MAC_080597_8934]EUA36457.1 hypothetical protein I549_5884 [Mycobacterium avium subsp. avium 2285 (R)]